MSHAQNQSAGNSGEEYSSQLLSDCLSMLARDAGRAGSYRAASVLTGAALDMLDERRELQRHRRGFAQTGIQ